MTNGTIQYAQASNASPISGLDALPSAAPLLSTTGSVNLTLPLQAHLGDKSASGTLTISSANLATTAPAVEFTGFSGWQNFTYVTNDDVLQMFGELGTQLGQLATQTWTANLPLLGNLSLAQVTDLSQNFQEAVTDQISTWYAELKTTHSSFTARTWRINWHRCWTSLRRRSTCNSTRRRTS